MSISKSRSSLYVISEMILVWTLWKVCRTALCRRRHSPRRITSRVQTYIWSRNQIKNQQAPLDKSTFELQIGIIVVRKAPSPQARIARIKSKIRESLSKVSKDQSRSILKLKVISVLMKNAFLQITSKEIFKRLQSNQEWVVIRK